MAITSPSASLAAATQAATPRRIQASDVPDLAPRSATVAQRPEVRVETAAAAATGSASIGPNRDLTKFVRPGSLLDIRA